MHHRYLLLLIPFALLLAIIFSMQSFSPLEAGPAGILFVFLLIYGFFLSIAYLAVYWGSRIMTRAGWLRKDNVVNHRRAYYIASVVSCLPVFLLAIKSIGQLRPLDILLSVIFVALATFYVVRRT
jgi:hypothetical protein